MKRNFPSGSLCFFVLASLIMTGIGSGCSPQEPIDQPPVVATKTEEPVAPPVPKPTEVKVIQGTDTFLKFLEENPMAIIDFTATWCGPCQRLAPELEKIASQYKEQGLKIGKVDVDRNPELSAAYKIQGIPDVRFFSGGKQVQKVIGLDFQSIHKGVEKLLDLKGAPPRDYSSAPLEKELWNDK